MRTSAYLTPQFFQAIADRYRIEEECGRGGTSIVYRARDLLHDRVVALKVMRAEVASTIGSERFLREVRIGSALAHPGIVPLLDSGETDGVLFCVFPFIPGETLSERLARDGPLPVDVALSITRQIGEALSHAHERQIIHRDVKPDNILLSGARALLADFGIARAIIVASGERVTDSGIAVGTPVYMSPEQGLASHDLDARTDQYALAICLYEMLAGDAPFTGRSAQAIIARHVSEPPPRLEVARRAVPPGVVAAIERGLAKVPADRYPTVADFLAALEARDTPLVREHRRPRWVAAVAAGAVAAVAVAAWSVLGGDPPLDRTRVVVFPARTAATGSDPDAGLRLADAIQVAVDHTEPLRWISGWELLDEATRQDPGRLRSAEARDIAQSRGARYFVTSVIERAGAGSAVTLQLHDAEGDSLVASESVVDSAGGEPPAALAIRKLPQLLARLLDPEDRVDRSPLAERKPSAIVRLLEAEEAYRNARFGAALVLYRRTVEEDSLFAFAALKGAQAASWQNQLDEALELVRHARLNEGSLPPKYRPYLRGTEAYLDGRADDAVAAFGQALAMDRDWPEAAAALGDVYYHLLPSAAPLDSLAEAAFLQATAIDSTFTPPLLHLAEIAIRRADARQATSLVQRLRREGADEAWLRHLGMMARCVGPRAPADGWSAVARAEPTEAMIAAKALAAGGAQLQCAAAGFRAALALPEAPAGTAWGAMLGLHGVLAAQGRVAESARLLDSARTAMSSGAAAYALIGVYADPGFRDAARAAEAVGLSRFGPNYERASPRTSWAFGVWEAWKGNAAAVEAIARRVGDRARETPSAAATLAAASLNAHAALVRGDTAEALRLFEALPVVAPRDSLSWEFFEPLAVDRIVRARLLLARDRPAEAIAVASVFDHQEPITFLAFLRPSLELRALAAERLRRVSLAAALRARLSALAASGRP
jgi:tRNA A-37 threonylcarbamoyl transferase component Bud32